MNKKLKFIGEKLEGFAVSIIFCSGLILYMSFLICGLYVLTRLFVLTENPSFLNYLYIFMGCWIIFLIGMLAIAFKLIIEDKQRDHTRG